jgi:hypothetical protein
VSAYHILHRALRIGIARQHCASILAHRASRVGIARQHCASILAHRTSRVGIAHRSSRIAHRASALRIDPRALRVSIAHRALASRIARQPRASRISVSWVAHEVHRALRMTHGVSARFASRVGASGSAQQYACQHRSSGSHIAHRRNMHRKSRTHTLRIAARLI